jgi:spore germination cell wall hydrolase CwlJ-like protein
LLSFRSALLIAATLTATIIAPANAGPSSETMVSVANATLPQVAIPQLLDPNGEPELAQPATDQPGTDQPQAPAADGDAAPDVAQAVPVKPAGDLTAMVGQLRGVEAGSHELECLATGIYFESKSEPLAGQLAVGKVIANRAQSGGRFPATYCGVLFQRSQFSFIRGHSLPSVPRASKQWQTAVAIAKIVDQKLHESLVGNALFFHARYVSPGWRLKRVASIGNHIFYR